MRSKPAVEMITSSVIWLKKDFFFSSFKDSFIFVLVRMGESFCLINEVFFPKRELDFLTKEVPKRA